MKSKKLLILSSVSLVVVLVALPLMAACAKPAPPPAPAPAPAPKPAPAPAPKPAPAPAPKPAPAPAPKPAPAPAPVPMPWDEWPIKEINPKWGWPKILVTNALGGRYPMLVGLGELMKKNVGLEIQVLQFSGSVVSCRLLLDGVTPFTAGGVDVFTAGWLGVDQWTGVEPGQLQLLAINAIPTVYSLVARTGSDIKSYADLKGKRIGAYNPAAPVYTRVFESALKAYGLTPEDIIKVPNVSTKELLPMIRENQIDACMLPSYPGYPSTTELTETGDAYIVGIDPDKVGAAMEALPYLGSGVVPAESFKGQEKPLILLSVSEGLYARTDVPESLAYTLVRVIWDNIEEFQATGSTAKKYFLPDSLDSKRVSIPFHPGAIRYYKETGWWTPELEELQQALLAQVK